MDHFYCGVNTQAKSLQEKTHVLGRAMLAIDGLKPDLNPIKDGVTLSDAKLDQFAEKVTGSASFQADGKFKELDVCLGEKEKLSFRTLPLGAEAYTSGDLVVVTTESGALFVEDHASLHGGIDKVVENLRPKSLGSKLSSRLSGGALTALGAAAGAVPGLGLGVNFVYGALGGFGQSSSRMNAGLLGTAANGVGVAAMMATGSLALAPVAAPIALVAFGVSALSLGYVAQQASAK